MMTLNGKTGKGGAVRTLPPEFEAARQARQARVEAQLAAKAANPQPTFSPVTKGTTKREVRRRNWQKRVG